MNKATIKYHIPKEKKKHLSIYGLLIYGEKDLNEMILPIVIDISDLRGLLQGVMDKLQPGVEVDIVSKDTKKCELEVVAKVKE